MLPDCIPKMCENRPLLYQFLKNCTLGMCVMSRTDCSYFRNSRRIPKGQVRQRKSIEMHEKLALYKKLIVLWIL